MGAWTRNAHAEWIIILAPSIPPIAILPVGRRARCSGPFPFLCSAPFLSESFAHSFPNQSNQTSTDAFSTSQGTKRPLTVRPISIRHTLYPLPFSVPSSASYAVGQLPCATEVCRSLPCCVALRSKLLSRCRCTFSAHPSEARIRERLRNKLITTFGPAASLALRSSDGHYCGSHLKVRVAAVSEVARAPTIVRPAPHFGRACSACPRIFVACLPLFPRPFKPSIATSLSGHQPLNHISRLRSSTFASKELSLNCDRAQRVLSLLLLCWSVPSRAAFHDD